MRRVTPTDQIYLIFTIPQKRRDGEHVLRVLQKHAYEQAAGVTGVKRCGPVSRTRGEDGYAGSSAFSRRDRVDV